MKWLLIITLCCSCGISAAQSCPVEDDKNFSKPSATQTLHGTLVLHKNLRTWFGLQLDHPMCGEKELQVIVPPEQAPAAWKAQRQKLEEFRGCLVSVRGKIDISPTGYYSANLFVEAVDVKPDPSCKKQEPLPDYSHAKPDPAVETYEVRLTISFHDVPITGIVQSGGRVLKPWQAYVNTFLSGGFVLWAECSKGYGLSHPASGPELKFEKTDGKLAVDAESGQFSKDQWLSYTCTRIHAKK